MGIRGLTKFVNDNHRDQCYRQTKLRDTTVVVDGYALSAQLYTQLPEVADCFGGDYDAYAHHVREFFASMRKCNVKPIVLLDGNYPANKADTICRRCDERIQNYHKIQPAILREWGMRAFPFWSWQLFSDLMHLEVERGGGVRVIRCEFEADEEVAVLARQLNCPVLSQDSDFFVLDVQYIAIDICNWSPTPAQYGSCFFNCDVYNNQYLINCYKGLTRDHLALLATMLGNDYVDPSICKPFIENQLGLANMYSKLRISAIIKWLQSTTFENAEATILRNIHSADRPAVKESISYYRPKTYPSSKLFTLLAKNVNESANSDHIETERNAGHMPSWFMDLHHKGVYPRCFLEIARMPMLILNTQLEDYTSCSAATLCFPIISALNEIINSTKVPLKVCVRGGDALKPSLIEVTLRATGLNLPQLSLLPNLQESRRLDLLFEILRLSDLKNRIRVGLVQTPGDWHVFLVSVIYWIRFSSPSVKDEHIYSVLVCALVLKEVRRKQDGKAFFNVIPSALDRIMINMPKEQLQAADSVTRSFFAICPKMMLDMSLYDVRIIHAFAQFQTSVFNIHLTNVLLNEVLPGHYISNFYNGTFLYNMCATLLKSRSTAAAALKDIFRASPQILQVVDLLFNIVKTV